MRRDGLSDRRASFGWKCAQPSACQRQILDKASAVLRPLRYPNAMRTAFNVAARRRSPMGAPQSGQVPSVLLMNTLPGTLRLTLYPPEFLEPRRRQLGIAPRVPDVLVA